MKHRASPLLDLPGIHPLSAMAPQRHCMRVEGHRDMAIRSEGEIYRVVAGCLMVGLIVFGLLELWDVIHI
jgi:hypothetical protein